MNKGPIQQVLRCRNWMAPDENCQIVQIDKDETFASVLLKRIILCSNFRQETPMFGKSPLIQVLGSTKTSQLDMRIIEGAVIIRNGRQEPNAENINNRNKILIIVN